MEGLQISLSRCRGQQGVHSSAANEDGCGYSVEQSGTPDCVLAMYRVRPMSVLRSFEMHVVACELDLHVDSQYLDHPHLLQDLP